MLMKIGKYRPIKERQFEEMQFTEMHQHTNVVIVNPRKMQVTIVQFAGRRRRVVSARNCNTCAWASIPLEDRCGFYLCEALLWGLQR